jgi:hypothetical protein
MAKTQRNGRGAPLGPTALSIRLTRKTAIGRQTRAPMPIILKGCQCATTTRSDQFSCDMADDLDAILKRIARLWSEMHATPTRDPKHARLMAEIHSQAATYLQLLDRQKTDKAPKAHQAKEPGRRDG